MILKSDTILASHPATASMLLYILISLPLFESLLLFNSQSLFPEYIERFDVYWELTSFRLILGRKERIIF